MGVAPSQAQTPPAAPPVDAKAYADLAKLPDWSGIWVPDVRDQNAQIVSNPTPWNPKAAAEAKRLDAEERAGNPKGLFVDCLPEGMPTWMMISHNPFEVLFTPGRVTLLGESDGNRLRRIYTDGRPHPEDPDLTFHGHSIGHWEGDTLVVETIGIMPQVYLAVSEAVGIHNNGDMKVVERIHLRDENTMLVEMDITAPHILTRPWQTTRIYTRRRGAEFDFVEGVCSTGFFDDVVDKNGDHVFVPVPQTEGGTPVPKQ
jgi:hypothetical protein